MYMWKPHIHEQVRDSTSMRGSEAERSNKVYMASQVKDEVRCLEASEGRRLIRRTVRKSDVY